MSSNLASEPNQDVVTAQSQSSAPTTPQSVAASQDAVTWGTLVFTVVLVSLLSSIGSIFLYDRFFATKFVSFDLPGYLKSLQIEAGKAGPGQEKDMAEKMQKSLAKVEKLILSQPKNVVVLSGDVVLGDSKPVKRLDIANP